MCMTDAEFSAIVCFACFQILWWNAKQTFLTPFSSAIGSCCFCLFVLRFFGPVNTIKIVLHWSINLSTLFLDRLSKCLTTLFARSFKRRFFAYHYTVNHPHTNIIYHDLAFL